MASTESLDFWRRQAAHRIQHLLTQLTGDALKPADTQADTLLRQLSNLPARPSDRAPYQGSFPNDPVSVARVKAANRIQKLILQLQDDSLQPPDSWIDGMVRSLMNLPERNGAQPYADLFPIPTISPISLEQLLNLATYASPSRLEALLPHLLRTMEQYDISTPLRQAHFLSQLIHESGSFNYVEEIDPGDYLEGRDDLGNIYPGDGPRYKGRGLIQITGRDNYAACGQDLGVDLITHPTRLMDDDLACLSAGWFWCKNGLNEPADRDDVTMVTRIINGGFNGFEERKHYLAIAKAVLNV